MGKLGLPKPKVAPCILRMIDQTMTKQVGLICNMKILVHRISHVTTFSIMQNNVVKYGYFILLLGRQDAKFSHDWVIT
jgi:hypothetical protein